MSKHTVAKVTLTSNRKEVERATEEAIQRGLAAIGMRAVTYCHRPKQQGGTPVDTGRLKNSIAWATADHEGYVYTYTDDHEKAYTDSAGSGLDKTTLVIGTNVEYGRVIEEGGYNRHAYHMLRNALTDGADEYERIMKANLEAANVK